MNNPFQRLLIILLLSGFVTGSAWAAEVKIEMETSMGTLTLALDRDKAPETVDNFVEYARKGFYDGTIFHRVINDFMIQGGGYTPELKKKETGYSIMNEAKNGLKNKRGSIAMARTSDPHSATAQFFINHKDNDFLDYPGQDGWGYAVFGKVTEGMSVVDAIARQPVQRSKGMSHVPKTSVVIKSVRVIE